MNNIDSILNENRVNFETKVETHERLYGKNSCFLICSSYSGLYQDDYCSFEYYSNITGERFKDNWTTACACPNYSYFETELTFKEALERGLIDIKLYNDNWQPTTHEIGSFYVNNPDEWSKMFSRFPKVEVYRGRSFKGRQGFFIGTKTIYSKGYPTSMAIVFDTNENDFFMVKRPYVRITEDFVKNIKKETLIRVEAEYKVEERIRKFDINDEKKLIDDLFFNGDWKTYSEEIYNLYSKWILKYEAEEEKKKYAPSDKLLQWVRDHFKDVTDENEIWEIGFKINKKNSRY